MQHITDSMIQWVFFFFRLKHESSYGIMMLAVGFLALILVVCFIIKLCFCGDEDDPPKQDLKSYSGTPIFAHELTPGTIVLQSANGEYFRILHEYSSSQNVNSGLNGGCSSSSATRAPSAIYSDPSSRRVGIEQAHTQTRPSAPPLGYDTLMNSYTPVMLQPPPYNETQRPSN